MKKLLIALLTISASAFSQSYLIMDNGIILTTDTNGFAYDLGQYAYPQKVTLKGGQYFVEDGNILATIDENGLLFRKYELIPEKILGKGINYFISDEGFLYGIDKKGYLKVSHSDVYKNTQNYGGNYFTVLSNQETGQLDFYVVTHEAQVIKVETPVLRAKDIVAFGGNYFMTNRGIVFTISREGRIISNIMRVGIINKRGGNYFSDTSNFFYTVSEDGELKAPGIPVTMKVNTMLKMGSNYFIDQQGKFFVIDKAGNVWEKTVRDQDFRQAKIISL